MSASHEYKETVASLRRYAQEKVERVLKAMLHQLFLSTPEDPIQFMIDYLQDYQTNPNMLDEQEPEADGPSPHSLNPLPVIDITEHGAAVPYNRGKRRVGVSAEPVGEMDDDKQARPVIPKSEEDQEHIRAAVTNNILFSSLDDDEMKVVIDAMAPRVYKQGEYIIRQGDTGDHFYVLDKGKCDCFVAKDGGNPVKVKEYGYGESFGELALMYNCPRAASIVATTEVRLWAMDRQTFRKMLMDTTSKKRKKYEEFLQRVPLLAGLDKYERSKVADALVELSFKDGEYIIVQGDRGHNMYFIKEGGAVATKSLPGISEVQEVMRYGPGDYFGELALMSDDCVRAANVISRGDTKCVSLDRDSFNRLLGPCEQVLKRNRSTYDLAEKKIIARQTSNPDLHQLSADASTVSPRLNVNVSKGRAGRRQAVAAEPMSEMAKHEYKQVVIPKTPDQEAAIREATKGNFLFQWLDGDQMRTVVDAMFLKHYKVGDAIINQGEAGDNFYVLNSGICDCYLKKGNQQPLLVKSYARGESFGELALMYNAPRAASIKCRTDVEVWALDRMTFQKVLMDTTLAKRKRYEAFLANVPLLASLDSYERAKIADALEPISFSDGQAIITQGEPGHNFYIVEKGKAVAMKALDGSAEQTVVYEYGPGGCFGELALIKDQPRAANVFARGTCECVSLDRDSFNRLLGPLSEILKRNQKQYEEIETRIRDSESPNKLSPSKSQH